MNQLEFVSHDPDPYVNVLLYGPPKSGKTVGAASAPGPILYLNADRPNATRPARRIHADTHIDEVRVKGLHTLVEVALELTDSASLEHYGAIVVDPIADMYRTVLEDISERALSPKIQHYGDTGTHIERFCRSLCEQHINVVFVAHETAVKDESTGGFERLPYTGTNNPAFGAKLMAMVDVIGYTGVVEGEGEDFPKYLAQLVNANGRRGGDRFGVLGSSRSVEISEWVDLARKTSASNGAEKE